MSRARVNLVPASLMRVRCFMSNTGRLKVEPWASAEETLDAFHDMLRRQRTNDAFWKDLEELLASLTRDMRKRFSGMALENELLDPSRHEALLSEIRSALEGNNKERGAFRKLSSALPAPAVAMLLLLGSSAVGCEPSTRLTGGADSTSDVAREHAPDTPPDTAADPPRDTCEEVLADITVNDGPCNVDTGDEECPHACKSFEEIVVECVPTWPDGSETDRCEYIECIRTMHESWRTGLTELFACWDCWIIEDRLRCDLLDFCRLPPDTEFDLEEFLSHCGCCIYLGVRLD